MATRMQQRRGTAQQWTDADPILAAGEIGFETDTNQFKIGDGVNHWEDLSYFKNLEDLGGNLDDYILLTEKAAANGVATLDSTGNIPMSQLGNIIDGAPALLDTLSEIATAIDEDSSFGTTILTALSTKAPLSSPALSGTPTSTTPGANDDSTRIATTEWVVDKNYVNQSALNDVIDDVTTAEGNIGTLQTDVGALQTSVGSAETNIGTLQSDVSSIQTNLASAETDIDNLELTVSGHTTSINGLTTDLNTAETDIDNLQSDVSTLQGDVTSLEGTVNTASTGLVDRMAAAESDIGALESTVNTATTGLVARVTVAEGEIDTLQGDLDTAEGNLSTLTGNYNTHSSATTNVHGIADTSALATKTYADNSAANAQTAAQTYADTNKAPKASPTFTGTITTPLSTAGYVKTNSSGVLSSSAAIAQADVTNLTTDLAAKAPLASPALTGVPTAPTATAGTNTTQIATTAFVSGAVSDLVASAPAALNTLNELATALGNDANFSTTVTNSLAAKAPLAGPTFTGTVTLPSTTSIGNVSSTEIGYLDGVTSAVQTQIDAKAPSASPTFTGTVALPATSSVTFGGTALSATLNEKADKTAGISSKTAGYTFASGDVNMIFEYNSASAGTFTIPADNSFWAVGQRLEVLQVAGGQLTIAGGAGVTVSGTPTTKTRTQWSGATIIKRSANVFVVLGDLASS